MRPICPRGRLSTGKQVDASLRKKHRPFERFIQMLLFMAASVAVVVSIAILWTLMDGTMSFINSPHANLQEFLTGDEWVPTGSDPSFGILPLMAGTTLIAGGALLIAAPLGTGAALYLSEFASSRSRAILKPIIEVLAGIPSIVYGFFALLVISPYLQKAFGAEYFNALSAMIVLSVMVLPIIVSISDDSMKAVPQYQRQAALAMGATRWETATRVVLPNASSGVMASILLGLGRAIGETMVVTLAAGRVANMTFNPLEGVQTMTAYIAQIATGDLEPGIAYDAAFAVGMVLFIITFIINYLAGRVVLRIKSGKVRRPGQVGKRTIKGEIHTLIARVPIDKLRGKKRVRPKRYGVERLKGRYIIYRIGKGVTLSCLIIAVIFLAYLVCSTLQQGLGGIDLQFMTYFPSWKPELAGIYPVIIGSVYLMVLTFLISVPVGVGAAVYLTEIAPDHAHTRFLRRMIQNLAGVPSIVFGLVGLFIFVRMFGLGASLLAGSLTLSIMVLPIIVVSTEEALKSIPQGFREGALALGTTRWQAIRHHVIPNAKPGILTGSILGLSRSIGETAPILFIGAVFAKVPPESINDPFLALPLEIFYWAKHANPDFHGLAASTIIILLLILLTMNSIAIVIRHRAQSRRDW